MFLFNNILELIVRYLDNQTTDNFKNTNSATKHYFLNNSSIYKYKLIDLFNNRIYFTKNSITVKSECQTKALSIQYQNNIESAYNIILAKKNENYNNF